MVLQTRDIVRHTKPLVTVIGTMVVNMLSYGNMKKTGTSNTVLHLFRISRLENGELYDCISRNVPPRSNRISIG